MMWVKVFERGTSGTCWVDPGNTEAAEICTGTKKSRIVRISVVNVTLDDGSVRVCKHLLTDFSCAKDGGEEILDFLNGTLNESCTYHAGDDCVTHGEQINMFFISLLTFPVAACCLCVCLRGCVSGFLDFDDDEKQSELHLRV